MNHKALIFLLLLALALSSCASSRTSYHKPRKPRKCDCSRWSQLAPSSIIYLNLHEDRTGGRA